MSSVTFPTAIGGDGSTVTDDDNATTGLRNGGWRTRFIPCFTNLVNIADYVVTYTASTTAFATPPPIGSTTPNTGAFTRVTVTGSTAPANGMYLPTTNTLGWSTGSTERLRLDSSGNLGLGVTPSAWRTDVSFKAIQMPGGTFAAYVAGGLDPTPNIAANGYVDSGGTWRYINSRAASWYIQNGGMHAWYTAPSGTAGNAISFTQAMTLDASGNLLVGTTSGPTNARFVTRHSVSNAGVAFIQSGSSAYTDSVLTVSCDTSAGTGFNILRLQALAGTVCQVLGNGNIQNTNNSYGAISDENIKENIVDATPKLQDLLAVKIRNFNIKGDSAKQIGVVAQELEEVFPAMIEENTDGLKGVKYSVFVPILVKAIQELSAELNELKQRIH